jgi:hypothetical protein
MRATHPNRRCAPSFKAGLTVSSYANGVDLINRTTGLLLGSQPHGETGRGKKAEAVQGALRRCAICIRRFPPIDSYRVLTGARN